MHIYIFPPKLLRWNFFSQILQLSIRSGAHKRFCRFRDFSQFLTAISRKLWRHLATNYVLHLKEQSHVKKKRWKPRRNRAINGNAMLVRTTHPWNARCSGLGAWQKTNKQKNKHIFAPTAGARCTIFPQTLHGDRARRAHHKRCYPFFDPTYSFSYRVHGKIWPNLPTRGFSTITP